jgi:hypothetical protein
MPVPLLESIIVSGSSARQSSIVLCLPAPQLMLPWIPRSCGGGSLPRSPDSPVVGAISAVSGRFTRLYHLTHQPARPHSQRVFDKSIPVHELSIVVSLRATGTRTFRY